MDASKKRLLIIVLFGLAAVGAVFLLTDPAISSWFSATPPVATNPSPTTVNSFPVQPAATVVPTAPPGANINSKTPVLPEGAQVAGQVMRDIFAPPAEYARLLPQETRQVSTNGSRAIPAGPMPVLTGIIVGDSTRVAILRQGTISRSHRLGESAGAYRIASIGTDSVTLAGPAGTVVLKMGQ